MIKSENDKRIDEVIITISQFLKLLNSQFDIKRNSYAIC